MTRLPVAARVSFAAALTLACASAARAVYYPLEIFTANGDYNDSPAIDVYMDVANGEGQVDFIFYNISTVESSLARIYFDDGSLLGVADVNGSAGTSFSEVFPGPGNIPGAELLDPPFDANREFSIGAENPPPENGVNPPPLNEWVMVSFELVEDGTLQGVIDELNAGILRVGVHIISLPDGSSEAAIAIPEPATLTLFALGALVLLRKTRR